MTRRTAWITTSLLLVVCTAQGLEAQQTELPPELQGCIAETNAPHPDQIVVQGFPSAQNAKIETGWCVLWENAGKKGLRIAEAWFKRKPTEQWIQVLSRAGLVEVFVPYHSGDPDLRLYDLQFGYLKELHSPDAGSFGTLLGSPKKIVIKEIRDRGVAWTSDHQLRRGEELRIWGVYEASNYEYVIQYGFWDSGVITFRVGATGYNNPGSPQEGHMHTALWRIDVDLDGPQGDTFAPAHHIEEQSDGTITPGAFEADLPYLSETSGAWVPKQFTRLRIEDVKTNANGSHIGYELVPLYSGVARHLESFSHFDYAVSSFKAAEADPEAFQVPGFFEEVVLDENIVLWVTSAAHHDPHDEDGTMALLRESGFDLVPHDFFDTTPLVDASCPSSHLAGSILQNWQIVKQTSSFGSAGTSAIATCPLGTSVLGGGGRIVASLASGAALTGSFPFPFSGSPNRWFAQARQTTPTSGQWKVESFAICGKTTGTRVESVVRLPNDPNANHFIQISSACKYGEAVLGGGGQSLHPTAGLTITSPSGPVCPSQWDADARKVPRTDDLSTIRRGSVICGNVPGYEAVTVATAKNSVGLKNVIAFCPQGKVVVGGGATLFGDATDTVLRMSWPRSINRPGDGWSAQAVELKPNAGDWQVQVTAICACYPGPC